MKLLQDLLSLQPTVAENQDEWEADEFHSRNYLHDQDDAPDAFDHLGNVEIASADEFVVEHEMDADMVHLLDGERTVRVSMPYHVWLELCQGTVKHEGS